MPELITWDHVVVLEYLEGCLHDRQKNGIDPFESGTVPIIFESKYLCCFMDPKQHRYFFTKIIRTIPLSNRSVLFYACHVNGPSVSSSDVNKQLQDFKDFKDSLVYPC